MLFVLNFIARRCGKHENSVHYVETTKDIIKLFFTARCTIVQSAVLRLHVVCLSVCPSVRPSVCL